MVPVFPVEKRFLRGASRSDRKVDSAWDARLGNGGFQSWLAALVQRVGSQIGLSNRSRSSRTRTLLVFPSFNTEEKAWKETWFMSWNVGKR